MNTYRIQHIAKTLAQIHIFEESPDKIDIDLDGYKITQWGFSFGKGPYGDAWVIEKNISAKTGIEAINIFRNNFNIIAEKMSFLSQCSIMFLPCSYIVEKVNNNENRIFFASIVSETAPSPLHVGKQHIEDFEKLKDFPNTLFFEYLHESSHVTGYSSKATLLCSALEALAGKITIVDGEKEYETYDKNKMKDILGKENYNKIFGYHGFRHKIQHGDSLENFKGENFVEKIYNRIIDYFNHSYGLKINTDTKFPQRHFSGNLKSWRFAMKPTSKKIIDIRDIPDEYSKINEKGFEFDSSIDLKEY